MSERKKYGIDWDKMYLDKRNNRPVSGAFIIALLEKMPSDRRKVVKNLFAEVKQVNH